VGEGKQVQERSSRREAEEEKYAVNWARSKTGD